MRKEIDLDLLQTCVERIVSLLKDRQPGLMSWNTFLHDRIQEMDNIINEPEPDTSDISEVGRVWFENAKVTLPGDRK